MVREGERITRIVEQLLMLTRRRPARREAVDLRAVAGDVLALLEVEARRRQAQLSLAEGGPCPAVCYPDQLRQVVLNLVRNALAAVGPGGRVIVSAVSTGEAVGDDIRLPVVIGPEVSISGPVGGPSNLTECDETARQFMHCGWLLRSQADDRQDRSMQVDSHDRPRRVAPCPCCVAGS